MLKSFTIPICLALGLTFATSPANAQVIREGVRRTSEAVAESGRAIARGTRDAVDRTGQAARNVIDNTTDVARTQVDRQQRSELQPGTSASIDTDLNARAQAGAGINSDQQLDGSLQTPLPNGSAMQGEYQAGYRGLNDQAVGVGQANYQGRVYRLRHDRNGREFICVNGRAVYIDNQQVTEPQQHEAYKLSEGQNLDHEQLNHRQLPVQPGYQSRQYQGSARSAIAAPQPPAPPAPPAPIRSDLHSATPASPSLNSDTNISADQRAVLDESADVETDAAIETSADTSANASSVDADIDTSAAADLGAESDGSSSGISASADADASIDDSNDQSSSDNENSNE